MIKMIFPDCISLDSSKNFKVVLFISNNNKLCKRQMHNKQSSANQRSERGRPKNSTQVEVIHPQRDEKAQQIKEYWTEHRITLIAYEAQYIYNKKNPSNQQNQGYGNMQKSTDQKQKKRKGRKKADPQFQTGFLFSMNRQQSMQQMKVDEYIRDYQNLSLLFNPNNHDIDDIEVRQFMKIMLQLKNQDIVHQFLPLYDMIYKQISHVEFEKVQKEKDRTQFLRQVENKLHQVIVSSGQGRFKKFKQYLRNDLKETLKLLYVESYCFLAERFNFNINQFYAEAFSITLQHNKTGNKKIKGE